MMVRISTVILVTLMLAGCGVKGDPLIPPPPVGTR